MRLFKQAERAMVDGEERVVVAHVIERFCMSCGFDLDESELEAFSQYREGRGEYARGRKGRKMYSGPGRNVGDVKLGEQLSAYTSDAKQGMTGMLSALTGARQASEKYEKDVAKRVKDYSNWWDKERASGERGSARVQELKAKGQATQAMRSKYAQGRGWGY